MIDKFTDEPTFVPSDKAYFNVNTKTIHAKEYGSFEYWHEYQHYKQNIKEEKFIDFISEFIQLNLQLLVYFLIIYGLFFININKIGQVGSIIFVIMMSYPAVVTFLYEIEANFFAWKKTGFKLKDWYKVLL